METVQILLVEDNLGDALLVEEALEGGRVINELNHVKTGEQALQVLRRQAEFSNAPRPHLVLLDIKLPKMSGVEVLEEIKGDSKLRSIPVIMLTSSVQHDDVVRAYSAHVNSYIQKPATRQGLVAALQCVQDYWFALVRLPPGAT